MAFSLNPGIQISSLLVGHHSTFQLRLVVDERFFWTLLIPEHDDLVELHDLEPKMNNDLMQLAATLGKHIQLATGATKINTATIGNVVQQFHLHVVARHADDEAWPAPVWGHGASVNLSPATKAWRLAVLEKFLATLS